MSLTAKAAAQRKAKAAARNCVQSESGSPKFPERRKVQSEISLKAKAAPRNFAQGESCSPKFRSTPKAAARNFAQRRKLQPEISLKAKAIT
jgi:hypothetical protein